MAHTPSEPTQLLLHRQHSILKNQLRRARPVPAGTHPGQGRLTLGAVCPSSFASLLPNLSLSLLHLYVPVASCSEHQDTPLQCWFLCTQIRGIPERFWQPSRGCWFPSHIRPKGQWLSFKQRHSLLSQASVFITREDLHSVFIGRKKTLPCLASCMVYK